MKSENSKSVGHGVIEKHDDGGFIFAFPASFAIKTISGVHLYN
jgi:hypothetical protein